MKDILSAAQWKDAETILATFIANLKWDELFYEGAEADPGQWSFRVHETVESLRDVLMRVPSERTVSGRANRVLCNTCDGTGKVVHEAWCTCEVCRVTGGLPLGCPDCCAQTETGTMRTRDSFKGED